MLKVIFECDLCGTKSAEVSQFHASATANNHDDLICSFTDTVNFPEEWMNIGDKAICGRCAELAKTTFTNHEELHRHIGDMLGLEDFNQS